MASLSQAYVHFRIPSLSQRELDRLGREIDERAVAIARKTFTFEITIEVELQSGSLKGWVTGIGKLLIGGYLYLGNYSGFLDSLERLCEQSETYATDVCGVIEKTIGVKQKHVVREDARRMTPGLLLDVIKQAEDLKKNRSGMSPREVEVRSEKILRDMERIEKDLTPQEVEVLHSIEVLQIPRRRAAPIERIQKDFRKRLAIEHPQMLAPPHAREKPRRYRNRTLVRPEGRLTRQ